MRIGFGKRTAGRSGITIAAVAAFALIVPGGASAGHGLSGVKLLDHPGAPFGAANPPSSNVNAGGEGAEWELIETVTTGNPHSDLDFFSQGGDTYLSAGVLAAGPNSGGQTTVKLSEGDEVSADTVEFISALPTAGCLTDPQSATGLQHDQEAAPKGDTILNTANPFADRSDTQVVLDSSDNPGRCHDQGPAFGLSGAPQGGLEIIDVTNIEEPVEIGLTSHIGESHTVNVDPKRPHIAYSVTSDAVTVSADANDIDEDGDTGELIRENEIVGDNDQLDLDGFEVVDFSSCMNFPAGTSVEDKRARCRPEVYRYRYPTLDMSLGHTIQTGTSAIFGCHELEIYPDDKIACGSGSALIAFDMSGAFDDMGTPTDFSDDKPRGTPLPCKVRGSSSNAVFATGAMVVDCVDGNNDAVPGPGGAAANQDLSIPGWIAQGAPSLEGVEYLGSIHHQGGGPGQGSIPPFDSTEDNAFNHESEYSGSGNLLLASDERGGGVVPPGATCTPGVDNTAGNGGLHFYKTSALTKDGPPEPEQAQQAYALTPEGEKAIFRAQIRTKSQATTCTAHLFQQIPGENRIFMAWYSQGTQVIDFVENPDGTVTLEEAGFMIPENANEWVSGIFKTEQNPDGTTTYYGAAGDFAIESGRNAIDVYKVTLPPAPKVVAPGTGGGGGGTGGGAGGAGAGDCVQTVSGSKSGEKLLGSIAGDRIRGRGGDDRINGRAGEDCLNGGGGKDRLRGDTENDTVKGGKGADRLKGNDGDDKLNDRSGGRDRLNAGDGRDLLISDGGGKDKVNCGKGRDRAIVDAKDQTRSCEKVKVRGRGRK